MTKTATIIETAKADKAGETTATTEAQEKDLGQQNTLTSEGVAALLRSEFAPETEADPKPDTSEVQPEGDETDQPKEQEQQQEQPKDEDEDEDEKEGLPTELQAAIDQWEAAGKGELPGPLQALVEKRIGKLTAQREQERTARELAEARASELEAKLQNAGETPALPGRPEMDEKGLTKLERATETFLADAENYLDDTATAEERARVEAFMASERLDGPGLKRRVRETNRFLSQELPQLRQKLSTFREQEARVEPEARKHFPWLWDKTTAEYGMAQEVLKVMPDLVQRTPAHRMALGIYVLGLKELEKIQGQNQKSEIRNLKSETAKAPPKTPANGSAAPRVAASNGRERQEAAARESFQKRPNRETAAELLRVSLRG